MSTSTFWDFLIIQHKSADPAFHVRYACSICIETLPYVEIHLNAITNISLSGSIQCFVGLTMFHGIFFKIIVNTRNILWNIVSPTKHCYGYELCYECHKWQLLWISLQVLPTQLTLVHPNANYWNLVDHASYHLVSKHVLLRMIEWNSTLCHCEIKPPCIWEVYLGKSKCVFANGMLENGLVYLS